jgi:hypothetical protein
VRQVKKTAEEFFFTTVRRVYRERIERTIMERLDAVDFSDRKIDTLSGRGMRTADIEKEYQDWYNRIIVIAQDLQLLRV